MTLLPTGPIRSSTSAARKGVNYSAVLIAAALIATPMVTRWEGEKLVPYKDRLARNILTWCSGETRGIPKTSYTRTECAAMTSNAVANDFGPAVLKCVPGLADRPKVLAASIVLTYNIGIAAFCKSTVAKRFRMLNWVGGCNAFTLYRMAGGKVIQGLINRRADERALCLAGAA